MTQFDNSILQAIFAKNPATQNVKKPDGPRKQICYPVMSSYIIESLLENSLLNNIINK